MSGYDNDTLITLGDYEAWARKEYSSWAFARLTGSAEVTVFMPFADGETIGLLETELSYRKPVYLKVIFNTHWWSYPWHRFCRWWEGF